MKQRRIKLAPSRQMATIRALIIRRKRHLASAARAARGCVKAAPDDGSSESPTITSLPPRGREASNASGRERRPQNFSRSGFEYLALAEPRLERFIGVFYRPETELQSHYSEAVLPRQFDAWVWFDETSALTPLRPEHAKPGAPDAYPFGLRLRSSKHGTGR
jgi:erythromycin esterase-like protein